MHSRVWVALAAATALLVTACGGGGGGESSPPPDHSPTAVPVLTSVQPSVVNIEGQMFLTAVVADAQAVTGYCFKTSEVVPTASDPCFQSSARSQALKRPQTAQIYYVWAKNAAGKVSEPFQLIVDADVRAPVLGGVNAAVLPNGTVALTATATDDYGVASYCFKTSDTRPLATDTCFGAASTATVDLKNFANQYYVWVQDFSGNISAPKSIYAGCGASAYYWSSRSALPTVCMSTSLGEVVFELEDQKAPNTTANFLRYVGEGYYSNTIFHRVSSQYNVVQGGGYTTSNTPKSNNGYPAIALESTNLTGLSHLKGTVAMARTNAFDSATTQFFINVVDNNIWNYSSPSNPGYAVFGRVIYGLDTTIESIRTVGVPSGSEWPSAPPVINWMYRLK